jgi:glycosyltransferase involved in cell wall biosynthesis
MYLPHRDVLNSVDVICATSDRPGQAIAFLKMVGLVRRPLVWWTMSLYDTYQNSLPRSGRALARALIRQAHVVITLAGLSQRSVISEAFGIPLERVASLHWGVDVAYYSPYQQNDAGEYIFTAGVEYRDFAILFGALRQSYLVLKMVAPISSLVNYDIPPNVQLIHNATLFDVKQMLNGARVVVVPTRSNHYCAGQWTVFSAMSMGKPVIWTEQRASEDYGFQHRHNISFVEPGSIQPLKREIQWHLEHPDESAEIGRNARTLMVEKWNMRHCADELMLILRSIHSDAQALG